MKLLQKVTTVEALVNLFIGRINSGQYAPGEKIPSERLLQREMGVGRLALREALSRLNAMGILSTAHGRGTFVQSDVKSKTLQDMLVPYFALNDPKRLHDLVVARGMLESEIAGLAAEQRSEDQLKVLYLIVEQRFAEDVSFDEVARQDLLFHRKVAEIVDNGFLVKMHKALTDHIRRFLCEYVKSKSNPGEVMERHRPILTAIEQGDSEAARHHARRHISLSSIDYREHVEKGKKEKTH